MGNPTCKKGRVESVALGVDDFGPEKEGEDVTEEAIGNGIFRHAGVRTKKLVRRAIFGSAGS